MIHNCSDISSQDNLLRNTYQFDGVIIPPNDSELYLLVQKAAGMTNTEEKKVNHKAGGIPVKTGLVKSLLIGAAVLTGVGALAAGGYYYMAGRTRSDLPENNLPSLSVPVMANIPSWGADSRPSTMPGNTLMAIMSSPLTTETPSSPYSYYEDIYGNTTVQNKAQSSVPVTTTEKPITTTQAPVTTTEKPVTTTKTPVTTTEKLVTTTKAPVTTTEKPVTTTKAPVVITEPVTVMPGSSTSAYMTAKPTITTSSTGGTDAAVTDYKHESGRSVYHQTVKGKYNYPLGTKFFNELLGFCLKETKYDIEQAYRGTQELRCKLLGDINDKIEALKEYETLVRRINTEKETLSAKEHGEEIMLRRKLATLYLAAEAIINKKDFDVFLREVNKDYKKHPTKLLEQREENIMNYFPQEC